MALELLTVLLVHLPTATPTPVAPLAPVPAVAPLAQERQPRAWMGISLSEDDDGLTITDVNAGSPAQRAGLRAGDRLLVAGSDELGSFSDLMDVLVDREPGARLSVKVRRHVDVELDDDYRFDGGRPRLGVYLGAGGHGVEITGVDGDTPAKRAGLREGDVLREVSGVATNSLEDVIEQLDGVGRSMELSVEIDRALNVVLGRREGGVAAEPAPPRRRRMVVPEPFAAPEPVEPLAPHGDLHQELRELAADLRELRREINVLREELQQLRRRGR